MKARIKDFRFISLHKGLLLLELYSDFRNKYDKLKDSDVEVTVEKWSENRSLRANAYLWHLVTQIGNALRESKEQIYLDMLKSYGQGGAVSIEKKFEQNFKRTYRYHEYLGQSKLNGKDFVHYRFWVGSSEYNREEFAILLDGVVNEAKNLGIEVKTEEEIQSVLKELDYGT